MRRIDWDGVIAGAVALAILGMIALFVAELQGLGL